MFISGAKNLLLFVILSSLLNECCGTATSSRRDVIKERLKRQLRELHMAHGLGELSELANDAYDYLLVLAMNATGDPNARVTCTEGYNYAAEFVASEMGALGLVPLGDLDRTTYVQLLEGSENATYCPNGMKNLLGMVPGSVLPDEYIVYNVHLNGPNNDNPQTQAIDGNAGISNLYDDGLGVAVGLAIAKLMMNDPSAVPERSVVFFFDDGEEGWWNVGERLPGQLWPCFRFRDTEWYQKLYLSTGGEPDSIGNCFVQHVIGASYWTINPTIDFSKINAIFVIDAIGSPYGATKNYIVALGGERVNYGAHGTMIDYLDNIWPTTNGVNLLSVPYAGIGGFGSNVIPFTTKYQDLCKVNCLQEGGLPAVWLAEPAFQKYHSGFAITPLQQVFRTLEGQGMFPSTVYYSLDNLAAFYKPNLDGMATSMKELLLNSASVGKNSKENSLSYNKGREDGTIDHSDIMRAIHDLKTVHDVIHTSQTFPQPTKDFYLRQVWINLVAFKVLSFTPVGFFQDVKLDLASLATALILTIDMFNTAYPEKEEFNSFYQMYRKNDPENEASFDAYPAYTYRRDGP